MKRTFKHGGFMQNISLGLVSVDVYDKDGYCSTENWYLSDFIELFKATVSTCRVTGTITLDDCVLKVGEEYLKKLQKYV